jgi:hypothetical protein
MANLKVLDDLAIKNSSGLDSQGKSILPQIGFVMMYAGTTAPSGWLICDGSTFSSATYPLLYAALGNTTTLPDLKDKYLVGTTNSGLIKTAIGSNSHTHPFTHTVTVTAAGADDHETTGAASDWSNLSLAHNHGGNYWFDVPGGAYDHRGGGGASNSYSNVPINVTAGTQGNVWNSTHGHGTGGGITYNAATVNHSHTGNFSTTTKTSTNHSHVPVITNVSTEASSSHVPATMYLNYIIKAG